MNIIVTLSKQNGMLFNHRRLSKDIAVTEDILNHLNTHKLYVHPFSAPLFDGCENIIVDEDFLNHAGSEDYCFVENMELSKHLSKIHSFILYNWNRNYPSDFIFDSTLLSGFHEDLSIEFAGNSHDSITKTVYVR